MTVIDYHDTRGLKEGIVSFVIICGRTIFASGHLVEIRSAAEILATLDGHAALDRMPFMPEMIPHTRRRYRVSRRVDKICDTIASTGSRRTHATVYLENLRCDGSGHDGCQAGCNLYRTEA